MNSTLQCLVHTPGLLDVFLTGEYVSLINRDNPLGRKGKIADEYGGARVYVFLFLVALREYVCRAVEVSLGQ